MSPIRLGVIALAIATFAVVLINFARADDPWSQSPYKGWADKQQVMPAAKSRMGCMDAASYCSCCNGSEIVKSKFRPIKSNTFDEDGWEWLNIRTNKWEQVPDDVIHWQEKTPNGQAVAFEYPIGSGILRCFFPPNGDGG